MSRPAPPRGVLFDATGTLIEVTAPIGETYHQVALEYGVDLPAWRLDDAFRRVLPRLPERGTGPGDEAARRAAEVDWWFEAIRQTFQAADSTARFDDFRRFAGALFDAFRLPGAWRLRSGVGELLADLRTAERPMGVVSNFDHRLSEILHHLEIDELFDCIHIPSMIGAAKPDVRLFQASADALGLPFDALVYVGDDSAERLEAIRAQGLTTLDAATEPGPDAWRQRLGLPPAFEPGGRRS